METKTFTQHGKLMYAIFIPLILFNLFLLSESLLNHEAQFKYYALLSVLFFLCLLCFYKITITISATTLSFSMGIGLIKKSYRLNEIKSCKAHKNSFMNGWGIRIIQGGWLYNVSGFHAIELRFKNNPNVIRIGTDKPEEVIEEVNKFLK
jgi:hypothetical protein